MRSDTCIDRKRVPRTGDAHNENQAPANDRIWHPAGPLAVASPRAVPVAVE